jgi:hypothetical protein
MTETELRIADLELRIGDIELMLLGMGRQAEMFLKQSELLSQHIDTAIALRQKFMEELRCLKQSLPQQRSE